MIHVNIVTVSSANLHQPMNKSFPLISALVSLHNKNFSSLYSRLLSPLVLPYPVAYFTIYTCVCACVWACACVCDKLIGMALREVEMWHFIFYVIVSKCIHYCGSLFEVYFIKHRSPCNLYYFFFRNKTFMRACACACVYTLLTYT